MEWKYREYNGIKVRGKADAVPQMYQEWDDTWVDIPNTPPDITVSFENSYIIEMPEVPNSR